MVRGPIIYNGNISLDGFFQDFQYFHFLVDDIRSFLLVEHSRVDEIMKEIDSRREAVNATTVVAIHLSKIVHHVKRCSCQSKIDLSNYYTASMEKFHEMSPLFICTNLLIIVL